MCFILDILEGERVEFSRMRTAVPVFRPVGTVSCDNDMLKMSARRLASFSFTTNQRCWQAWQLVVVFALSGISLTSAVDNESGSRQSRFFFFYNWLSVEEINPSSICTRGVVRVLWLLCSSWYFELPATYFCRCWCLLSVSSLPTFSLAVVVLWDFLSPHRKATFSFGIPHALNQASEVAALNLSVHCKQPVS